ncbi:flippase-like domain-containing protein [Candidatus Woesearchaeota archaeon]|nr:flippase-like domain-containing protein [Candidatus Woesearchaeota archaeon]
MVNKKLISNIVLLITLVSVLYYVLTNLDEFEKIRLVEPIYLIPLACVFLFYIFTNGLLIKFIIAPFGIKLGIKEWLGISVLIQFYNTITPFKGGFLAKAAYLKEKHSFSYTDFIATVTGFYIINLFVTSICGLTTILILLYRDNMFSLPIFFIFLITFSILSLIIIFSREFPKSRNKLLNRFIKVANGWDTIKNNRKIIVISLLISLAQLSVSAIGIWVSYNIFGVDLGFVKSLFLQSIITIGSLIAITPGALGITETIQIFSASILNVSASQSLTAALTFRLISSVIILTIGPIISYKLIKHKSKKSLRT